MHYATVDDEPMQRVNPHVPDVKCDSCMYWIPGELFFLDDLMLCRECYKLLAPPHKQALRGLQDVSFLAVASTLVVSSGVAYGIDAVPVIDFLATLTSFASGLLLGAKVCSTLRRR